ncbi:MAG: polysaccharide deacetylase family protein [Planctomycetes bacterium]|nr:polysaccharide deacetylase family protein [Planctomycetota bacterium]
MLNRCILGLAAVVFALAATALADGVLQVTEVPGDHYVIKAVEASDPTVEYWQCKVDVASGCIFQFLDLTDAGDGAGGHTDYMGTNSGYNRKCSLLEFNGRGGRVGTRSLSVAGLEGNLSFQAAGDGSAFTIRYEEDETSAGFFQSSYSTGEIALTPGDLLTTITVIIRPPTSAGTAWDWSVAQRNVSEHGIDPRVWAKQETRTCIQGAIPLSLDSETSDVNGYWDDAAPVSFGRYIVGANSLGLTAGRQFVIDYRYDMVGTAFGNTVTTGSWAGFAYMVHNAAHNGTSNYALPSGQVRTDIGQLRIDIAAPAVGAAPAADAGDDQVHTIHTTDPATVLLDGAASADSDGTIVSYTWVDGLGAVVAQGPAAALHLQEGDYYFTLIVTDDDGNTACDEVRVQVIFQWDWTLYDAWPGRDPGDPDQLVNLYGQSIARPVIRDLVWPSAPGQADVCLYADDKFAAVSLTVDDNTVPDHAYWIDRCDQYGLRMAWFVIVGSHRLNSGNGYFGTWEVFQANIVDHGQEVQSHTISHKANDHERPADEMHWEYSYSRALIDAHLTGNRCLTLAYPSGNGQPAIAANYYIAARGTVGGVNAPHNTNYLFTNAGSLSAVPRLLDPQDVYARGWIVPLYHLIQDEDFPALEANLAMAAASGDRLWFGSFTEVAKYGQQRDTATLTVTSAAEAAGVRMTLTDRMWDGVFDYPLTVKVRVWNTWTTCTATQGGQPVEAALITHEGNTYALVKAVPDRGEILLTPAQAAQSGDADGDGDVDLDDFVILKTTFGASPLADDRADFDDDGDVDLDDFVILKTHFGS